MSKSPSCFIHSSKSKVCSTDCIYHSTMNDDDYSTVFNSAIDINYNSFADSNSLLSVNTADIAKKIESLVSIQSVGPFISSYRESINQSEFLSEKYFNFPFKEKHKGTNKVLLNIGADSCVVKVISIPLCEMSSDIEKEVRDEENNFLINSELSSKLEKYKRKISLNQKDFIILPTENYFHKIENAENLHVLHGYFVVNK